MIAVSDTSCVSNLLTAGSAHLLTALFRQVLIPPAVADELSRFHTTIPDWLLITRPPGRELVARLQRELDLGEAEAIAAAIELRADRALIDETIARRVALREGVKMMGALGVLLAAKRKKLIPALMPIVDRLQSQAGFYVSSLVRAELRKEAEE